MGNNLMDLDGIRTLCPRRILSAETVVSVMVLGALLQVTVRETAWVGLLDRRCRTQCDLGLISEVGTEGATLTSPIRPKRLLASPTRVDVESPGNGFRLSDAVSRLPRGPIRGPTSTKI